jgi:protease I
MECDSRSQNKKELRMRIACVLDNDYEDSEFEQPVQKLRDAGHEVVVIGFDAGQVLKGKQGKVTTRSDLGIAGTRPDDFDALLIPGGYSPDHLRGDPRFVSFTKAFFERERPVFAVCHGPQLLMTAGVTQGRTLTAWQTIQDDLRYSGADVVDQEVVVDGNLVTSRKPGDLEAFSREAIKQLERIGAGAR